MASYLGDSVVTRISPALLEQWQQKQAAYEAAAVAPRSGVDMSVRQEVAPIREIPQWQGRMQQTAARIHSMSPERLDRLRRVYSGAQAAAQSTARTGKFNALTRKMMHNLAYNFGNEIPMLIAAGILD